MKQMSYEFYVDVKLLFQIWKFTVLWDSFFFFWLVNVRMELSSCLWMTLDIDTVLNWHVYF